MLPDGMTINPAAANGLAACADADFLKKNGGGDYIANTCPAASAIGPTRNVFGQTSNVAGLCSGRIARHSPKGNPQRIRGVPSGYSPR